MPGKKKKSNLPASRETSSDLFLCQRTLKSDPPPFKRQEVPSSLREEGGATIAKDFRLYILIYKCFQQNENKHFAIWHDLTLWTYSWRNQSFETNSAELQGHIFAYATARFLHFSFGLIHIPPCACAEADRALIKQQHVLAARFPGRTILQAVAWQSAGVKKKLFLPRCFSQLHVERERERSQEVKWTPDTLRLICTDFSCAVCSGISLPPTKNSERPVCLQTSHFLTDITRGGKMNQHRLIRLLFGWFQSELKPRLQGNCG